MLLIGCMSDSILSVSAKDVDTGSQKGNSTKETVSCNLSIDGGNGYIVIEDENGTFEKSYYYENSILFDEDKNPVDDTKLELPKSKNLTVSLVAEDSYCVEKVSLKDKSGKNIDLKLEEELPALQTSFSLKTNTKTSLEIEFLHISDKYLDLGISAMDTNTTAWSDAGTGDDLCTFLGIDGRTYYNYLYTHSQDNWYIGTKYPQGGYFDGANGADGWINYAGAGMNCEGFVDNVLYNVGASHAMAKAAGGQGWVHYLNHSNLKHYVYKTKQEMLDSGNLEYGDIIWMFTGSGHNSVNAYHHVGIFVGSTPYEDKFWHSIEYTSNKYGTAVGGNEITSIIPKDERAWEWVIVKAGAVPKTYTSLTVQKTWNDQYDKFGLRPSVVTVDLYWWSNVDSTRHYYKTAELTAANNWTVTWDNLERSDGNVMYEYTAVEREVPNYSSTMQWYGSYENGWTGYITNTLKTYTSLSVKKLWDDQENQFELQPSSIKVNLYWWSNKDSTRHYYKTATLSAENNWFVTWDNLEYVDGDTTYGYDVEEEEVSEYTGKMQWTGSYKDGWVGSLTNSLKTGNAKVLKTSTSPELTDGNDCYSLKDAVYGIYTTADCKESSLVALMTTKENGESDAVKLPIGTYHVKEVTAPKGYALDKKIHTVEIKLGETYLLKVSDKPTMDPVGVLLGKIDKETNQNKPEGSLPMEGALFEVKFYAGVQMDSDPAESGKKATRSWVFRTNENGFIYYEKKYLSSGDELYMSLDGNPGLPIGTLTFKETQAPEGYLLNPEIYTVKITSNNDGSEFVNTYNAPKIPEQSLDLNLVKKEKGKDYVIEGVVFELTKPDGSTETATTDANGTCKFKALGYGQHKVREISAPDGYAVNDGIITFTVAKDNTITVDSNTSADDSMKFSVESDGTALLSVEDTLAPYKLKITKVNEKGTTLEDAEFTIYEDKECKHELAKIVTDKTGIAITNPLAVEKLYYIKETKAPQGYRIPQDAQGKDYVYEIYTKINDQKQYEYYVNGQVHTEDSGDFAIEGTANERIVNLKVENQTTLQMPNTGTHTTLLIVLLGISCMTVALIRQTKRGKKEKKDEKSEKL